MTMNNQTLHIGLWEGPRLFAVPTDGEMLLRFSEIREAGIDTMFLFAELAAPEWLERTLRVAKVAGLRLIVDTSAVWRDAEKSAALLEHLKDEPAVAAFNIMDEPPVTVLEELAPVFARYKEAVGDKPVFINLNPNYAPPSYLPEGESRRARYRAYLDRYLSLIPADKLSFDFYPFVGDPAAEASMRTAMIENLTDISLAARAHGIPFGGFLQTSRWGKFDETGAWRGTRIPSEGELRYLANLHLLYGAGDLTDFLYWSRSGTRPDQRMPGVFDGLMSEDGKRTQLYTDAQRVHREAQEAAQYLLPCRLDGIMTAGMTNEENDAVGEWQRDSFAPVTRMSAQGGHMLCGCFLPGTEETDGLAASDRVLFVMNAATAGSPAGLVRFRLDGLYQITTVTPYTGSSKPFTLTSGQFGLCLRPGDAAVVILKKA